MSSDDSYINFPRILAHGISDKGIGTAYIQSCHTANFLGVVNSLLLQNFGSNWHSTVDGVGDNGKDSIGAVIGTSLDKLLDNSSVRVEKIVTCHARLSGNPSRDDDDRGILQCGFNASIMRRRPGSSSRQVTSDVGVGRDVGKISSHTGCSDNIIAAQLSDLGRQFEQQTQGLTNTTSGSKDGNFFTHGRRGRVESGSCLVDKTASSSRKHLLVVFGVK
mmetsp:Transcript_79874/g.231845  ORF Transcript_79874/g.231845 Transcript_79874/m.231845 type:complete len:219 (-) Transcript_79874:64-720(-)